MCSRAAADPSRAGLKHLRHLLIATDVKADINSTIAEEPSLDSGRMINCTPDNVRRHFTFAGY